VIDDAALQAPAEITKRHRFSTGAMDGNAGIEAARAATLEVMGKGQGDGDGWSDEDADEAIAEEGARGRRKGIPNGRVVAGAESRAAKAAQVQNRAAVAVDEQVRVYKARRLALRVLATNAAAEGKVGAGDSVAAARLTLAELQAFVRARTGEPVPQTLKRPELEVQTDAVRKKPIVVQVSLEPDGYPEWLAEQAAAAEAPPAAAAQPVTPSSSAAPSPPAPGANDERE
jgi:hypothetical protein